MAKNKELKKVEINTPVYHIYDFLIKCKINRNQHNVLLLKYEHQGLKTLDEWRSITDLTLNQ